jgi:hypothetical protein
MSIRKVTPLEEDLKVLGLSKADPSKEEPETDTDEEEESEDQDEEMDEDVDPLDAPEVNHELFEAIMGLPFDNLVEEDVDDLLDALKEKVLPEDASMNLKEEAHRVVDHLFEVKKELSESTRMAIRKRAGKAGVERTTVARREGRKKVGGKDSKKTERVTSQERLSNRRKNRIIRKTKAAKIERTDKKRDRMRRTTRGLKTAGLEIGMPMIGEDASPFARELNALVEDNQEETITVRHEIMERVSNIFEMLNEEFRDEDVERIFENTFDGILSAWEAGRLDEDVMEEDEFIGEVKPVLVLIQKSLDRIDRAERGELGN